MIRVANQDRPRNLTVPVIAEKFGVSRKKVVAWIRSGELAAMNLSSGDKRPRYSITPDALEQFERGRLVIPQPSPARRIRRRSSVVKSFF